MIEKLTADKLREYGFIASHIDEIMKAKDIEVPQFTNIGEYNIVINEMKIYSGVDLFLNKDKPLRFPGHNMDLLPDYFRQRLELYLQQGKKDLGITFDELECIEAFKQSEIIRITDAIKNHEKFIGLRSLALTAKQYEGYRRWLNRLNVSDYIQRDGSDIAEGANNIADKYLKEYIKSFNNNKEYLKAVNLINLFFLGNGAKNIDKPIFIKKGNIRSIAFALGEIWKGQDNNDVITIEYLQYCKSTFTIFHDQRIDSEKPFGTNLYKYMISKT